MALLHTPQAELGAKAVDFSLPAVDGKTYALSEVAGTNGLLIMFICNHCPYVQRQTKQIAAAAKQLIRNGIGVVAISANDAQNYPEDSFENMKVFAHREGFTFPYLYDESQEIAKAYGAVCTPDYFGFNAALALQFRGRLVNDAGEDELVSAMLEIAQSGETTLPQHPSMGCSIKWKF